jgi:hypothetical protein
MGLFLAPEELAELTDYTRASDQRRWLEEHGWKFEVSRTGRPKVLRAEAEQHMLSAPRKRIKQLNLAA